MKLSGVFLLTGVLALTACTSAPLAPDTGTLPVGTAPSIPIPKLGIVEIEFSGGDTRPLQAQVAQNLAAQALADQPCVVLGSVLARSTVDLAGKRYLQATFPVTNNCAADLENLTYVAVRRLGDAATLGGSAVTSMKTFGDTDAAVSLATQVLPTQPVYLSGDTLKVDQSTANLQVFDDTVGGELDGLQAQVDPSDTTYDLLPYGFVATTSTGSRVIPAGGTGKVTVAVSLPIQTTADQNAFKFGLLMGAATNTVTSVTQGLEEQDAAGKAAVEARAAALPLGEVHTLLGPTLTPTTMASSGRVQCSVRIAGPRSAPAATLVAPQFTALNLTASNLPMILGGRQTQPLATLTVNGMAFPVVAQYRSTTPTTLSVTGALVHPVASFPLARQTGTLEGEVCGQTASVTLRTSPVTSLALGLDRNFTTYLAALNSSGQVVYRSPLADSRGFPVPGDLSGLVAVAASADNIFALKDDGTVVSYEPRSTLPPKSTGPAGLNGVTAIAAGYAHALALKDDGTVVALGQSSSAGNNVPVGLRDVVAIAAGGDNSLALKSDGTVVAWGNNANVPVGLKNVVSISAGRSNFLALKADGTVVAWGVSPAVPLGLSGVTAIAAGDNHSLALKADGTVAAWGANDAGQVTPAIYLNGVAWIVAGVKSSVAVSSGGGIFQWGIQTAERYPLGQILVP